MAINLDNRNRYSKDEIHISGNTVVASGSQYTIENGIQGEITIRINNGVTFEIVTDGTVSIDGDIRGSINAEVVNCDDVHGSIDADVVNCDDVHGPIDADTVTCDDVYGSINASVVNCDGD